MEFTISIDHKPAFSNLVDEYCKEANLGIEPLTLPIIEVTNNQITLSVDDGLLAHFTPAQIEILQKM